MGKAANWFRGFLGLNKLDSLPPREATKPAKGKRRWSFVKSYKERESNTESERKISDAYSSRPNVEGADADPNSHAIAVATATTVVAEAAVAAAHAAAAVVLLTRSGRCTNNAALVGLYSGIREGWAAVKIQSTFRGYLGRKALRALKSVVRLQALVRGHIERKRTAEWLQRMQTLLHAQAHARAGWIQISESSNSSCKSSQFHHLGPATPEKFEHVIRAKSMKYNQLSMLKRNESRSCQRIIVDQEKTYVGCNRPDLHLEKRAIKQRQTSTRTSNLDDKNSEKILEIDTGKSQFRHKYKNLYYSSQHALASDQVSHNYTNSKDSTTHLTVPSPSSCEIQSLRPLKFTHEESTFSTADNSHQFLSASSIGGSSRRSPFTPSKSDGSRSYLSGYSDHPNYMAYTESSKAKSRSLSAPKQRPQVDMSSSRKRYSIPGFGEPKSSTQRALVFHGKKPYSGSGRLDRLGMPVGYKY